MSKFFFKLFFPVNPWSIKGKLLVLLLKLVYSPIYFFSFGLLNYPRKGFEENPAYYRWFDALYLGFKYYFKPIRNSEKNQNLRNYFRKMNLQFFIPQGYKETNNLSLNVGGDLMPYEFINQKNAKNLWSEVGEDFFSADIVFANLETPIDVNKPVGLVPEVMLNDMYFNGNEDFFNVINGNGAFKGFDVLSIANNHMLDMGEKGLINTLNFLENKKVSFVGSSKNLIDYPEFIIKEINQIKIAFVAFTYSMNKELPINDKLYLTHFERLNNENPEIANTVNACLNARKAGADLVVLSLHTGNAYQVYPSVHTVNAYHKIFQNSGVDIILGGHPHNAQPMEKFEFVDPINQKSKQGFSIYSLADFVSTDIFVWCRMPITLSFQISKGVVAGEIFCGIKELKVRAFYICGNFDGANSTIVFKDLKKLKLNNFEGLNHKQRIEAEELWRFYTEDFLPQNHEYLIS